MNNISAHEGSDISFNNEKELKKLELDKQKNAKEHYRLAGRPPLKTVLILSIGPILSQLTGAIYGIVDTIYVSHAIGQDGMTAISAYTAFDNIARAFGFFVSVAGSTKISALFAAGQSDDAGQVLCDLLRVCLFPAILMPTIKEAVRWFGATEAIVSLGWDYMFPLLLCSVFTCIYTGIGGFLQGEGRSGLFGIVTIVSSIFNMGVFKPLFLYGFKMGIRGSSIATCVSEAIPGISVTLLFFFGKFAVKPKFNQLLQKFSKNTFPALRVGLSQLISNISVSIPGIICRKLIGLSVSNSTDFNDSLAGFNVLFKWAQVTNSVVIAITMGFLPAASYAYQAKNAKRWFLLAIHSFWIALVWGSISSILTWGIPKQVALLFANHPGYLKWASQMLKYGNGLGFFIFSRFNFPAMLQSMSLGLTSTVLSLTSQLVSLIGFSLILYYTDQHNPIRLCWCYSLSYAFGFVFGSIILIFPMIKLWRESKLLSVSEETPKENLSGEGDGISETQNVSEL